MTSPQKNNRKTKHAGGRPKLAAGAARVVLPSQRVAPETLAQITRLAPAVGGIGRLLDSVFSD